jgi:NDP-sugar pyrophosphorylase family protein
MFTGIQIFEPGIFDYIPHGVFSHSVTDVFPQAMAKGERIAVHVAHENWYELSTIQRYLDISLRLLSPSGESVTAGKGCEISGEADISQSVLWDNVAVESGAQVKRVVLGDNVRVRSGESIENAAVVRASLVEGREPPAKALKGQVKGDNFVVPLTQ